MKGETESRVGPLPIAPRWDDARTERLLGRVHARIDRGRRARRSVLVLAPVVALLAALLVGVRHRGPNDVPAVARPAGDRAAIRVVMLGDGSRVELRDGASEMRVRSDAPAPVRVELTRGAGRFFVTHQAGRTFEVVAGAVTVAVVGTEFTVELRDDRTWVDVQGGTVRVSWPADSALLSAGESGLFPPAAPAAEAVAVAGAADAGVGPAAPLVLAYRSSVGRRDYGEAYAVLAKHPGIVADTVDELLTAADVARLSGHAAQAVPFLERAAAHSHDGRAPQAAFTLGRTLLGLGRSAEAEHAFAEVRARWPQSPLAEDALVRQIEAAARSGDLAAARRLADQYDQVYPQGRRRSEARRHAGIE